MRALSVMLVTLAMLAMKNILDPLVSYALYAFIGIVYIVKFGQKKNKLRLGKSLGIGILCGIAAFAVGLCITAAVSFILDAADTAVTDNGSKLLNELILSALIPCVCEELFFRGMLQTELERVTDGRVAVAVTAMFFALFHLPAIKIPAMFTAGIAFGYVYLKTGRLEAAVTAHFVNNALAVIISNM